MTTNVALHHRASRLRTTALVLFAAALGLVMAAGCLDTANERDPNRRFDPLNQPEFLTPVAEAQSAGVDVYWMGETFPAGSLLFELNAVADATPIGDKYPGLGLQYGADIGGGFTTFALTTFPDEGGGTAESRARIEALPAEISPQNAQVGPWEAEVFLIPSVPTIRGIPPDRPANHVFLFVDVGDMTIVAVVDSGSTGVPGEDVNPLLDSELLIEVVAEHLRPFPE